MSKAPGIVVISSSLVTDTVDGFEMGNTRSCMWIPSRGPDQPGRYRVEWFYPLPPKPPRKRKWPTEPRVHNHDCDSLAEAEAYLAARTKYENRPDLTIRIVDKAERFTEISA
jgi:hypothetical protein